MARKPTGRKTAIIETARQRFIERGYEATTIGDIAAALGISKAAVSYYFPTKAEFLDVIAEPLVASLETLLAGAGTPTWPSGVREALGAVLDALTDQQDVARWIDRDITLRSEHHYGDRLDAITESLIGIITGNRETPLNRARALAVIGGIWRPILELDRSEAIAARDEILDAAMISYAPIDNPSAP